MKYGLLSLALASVLAVPCFAEEVGKPTIVPVKRAPFHMFTFQDENMLLVNVMLPAGFSTGYHSHNQDQIFVITAGAKVKNQVLGKDPIEREFKLGDIVFVHYAKTPLAHQLTNLEKDNAMRLLALEIVYSEPGRYTVSTRDAKYEVAVDNDRVRAWRLKLNPGESAPVIQQKAPGARIVVTGGTVAEKRPGKPDHPMMLRNGDFMTTEAEERGVENIGNSPVEIVEIELK